jgi:hypothetical protein
MTMQFMNGFRVKSFTIWWRRVSKASVSGKPGNPGK